MAVGAMEIEKVDPERVAAENPSAQPRVDWALRAREVAKRFAGRSAMHDATGDFVTVNYREMKAAGFFSAGIPVELGGGGASHGELTEMIREIGRHDGSTALAYAMHTHPVAVNVFKHRRGDARATAALSEIAAEQLVVAGTGATDWLGSSGSAERVDGGFRVHAQKRFVSGSSGADLFVTSARYDGPDGPEVIHFTVPFARPEVRVVESWNAHGMRGTGSNNVTIDDLFVEDDAILLRRPADVWHPVYDTILPIAMPLIVAAYVGLAESAVAVATETAERAGSRPVNEMGGMLTQLALARMALADMVRLVADYDFEPTMEVADATLRRKSIATDAVDAVVEYAADLVGGAGFMRGHPLERVLRDVRAMRFHPLPSRKQRTLTGRLALGLQPA